MEEDAAVYSNRAGTRLPAMLALPGKRRPRPSLRPPLHLPTNAAPPFHQYDAVLPDIYKFVTHEKGLLGSGGDYNRRHRRLCGPPFRSGELLRKFGEVVVDRWGRAAWLGEARRLRLPGTARRIAAAAGAAVLPGTETHAAAASLSPRWLPSLGPAGFPAWPTPL